MNRLQLCNRLILEAGISAQSMATTLNQTGELGRVVAWIDTAWEEIQSERQDWLFLRTSMPPLATVDGQAIYTLSDLGIANTFAKWDTSDETFRCYVTAAGLPSELFMDAGIDYDTWRNAYYFSALRDVRTRPTVVAIGPAKQLCLGPVPAAGYTITGDYFQKPVAMAADADTPACPSQFHMAIVWKALEHYGAFESAPEAYARGQRGFKQVMNRLRMDQLPDVKMGGALA